MNSCAIVSGNLAGWTKTPFLRGGGLWINHDFWNFNQLFESRLFSLLDGMGLIVIGKPVLGKVEASEFRKLGNHIRKLLRQWRSCRQGIVHGVHFEIRKRHADRITSGRAGKDSEPAAGKGPLAHAKLVSSVEE
jgi:hypothetical protein